MGSRLTILTKLRWLAVIAIAQACVDPIYFDAQVPRDIIVLEGSITSEPGPYVINLTRGLPLESDSTVNFPVAGASIVLHSDKGEAEKFNEVAAGKYSTGGSIRGTLGVTYYITLTMPDGATFQSEPETIRPSGEIEEIRFQYEPRTVQKSWGPQPADVFNIYVDANAAPSEGQPSFVRWRFTGTFVMETNPELHMRWLQGANRYMDPWPCSGYEVEPFAFGGYGLVWKRECTCCRCWITEHETIPRLSDNDLVMDGQFRNVKVAEVAVTRRTFYEKYKVTIDQMTLSKNAFDYFKIIRTQKDGATNLFQPPPGKLTGNIKPVNSNYEIIGLFWAASYYRKSIYIPNNVLPYVIARDIIPIPCDTDYANSTATQPSDWQ